MKKQIIVRLATLTFFFMFCLVGFAHTDKKEITAIQEKIIPSDVIGYGELADILLRLAYEHEVPIGLELEAGQIQLRPERKNYHILGGKLKIVLNQIMNEYKAYDWEVGNGFIHVYPKENNNEKLGKALALQVDKLVLKKESTQSEMLLMLWQNQNLAKSLNEYGLSLNIIYRLTGSIESGNIIFAHDLAFENASIKDILNTIIVASNKRYWCALTNNGLISLRF